MQLFCDIGNTNIKTGFFQNALLTEFKIFENTDTFLHYFFSTDVSDIAISSVVPSTLQNILGEVEDKIPGKIFIITNDVKFNLKINYETQDTLGIDRICAAEGAYFLYKQNPGFHKYKDDIIIAAADFGTATTINIVTFPAVFSGGLIAPGIDIMFSSLNLKTAQLPLVSAEDYKSIIGKSTDQSIASGVLNSAAGFVESVITKVKQELNASEVYLYITGGNAKKILPLLSINYSYEPALVLYGVKAVYELNQL